MLPGAAGTVQEIFQMATRLYYQVDATGPSRSMTPLILVGREHWTERLHVWPLLQALLEGRPMAGALHLVDTVDEAAALLVPGPGVRQVRSHDADVLVRAFIRDMPVIGTRRGA